MNTKAKVLKAEIVTDMNSIVKTLESEAAVVRQQKGVGCEFCADKMEEIIKQYKGYIRRLVNLN